MLSRDSTAKWGRDNTKRLSGFFWFFVVGCFFFFYKAPISRAGVVTSSSVPETSRISRNVKCSPAPQESGTPHPIAA